MMVVMNAERFGIAQLHQLRGRVGRGARKSKCLLVASTTSSLDRLKVLEKSSDGFYLANMDLLLRGPGDLLGKKQSGHLPEFPIARLEIDGNILQEAHAAALVCHFSEVFSFKFFLLELSIFIQNKSYISSYSYELVIFGRLITSVSSINCLC
jgi:RecG-like helicase